MDLGNLKNLLPEHAKDLKLNLSTVLSPEGAPGLAEHQILATALASAVAARNPTLLREIESLVVPKLDAAQVAAARAAAVIMGMNNVYYRFVHLVENPDYAPLPARLRMNVIGNPGVAKVDFELYSLAVSAINGCGTCLAAHDKVVRRPASPRKACRAPYGSRPWCTASRSHSSRRDRRRSHYRQLSQTFEPHPWTGAHGRRRVTRDARSSRRTSRAPPSRRRCRVRRRRARARRSPASRRLRG